MQRIIQVIGVIFGLLVIDFMIGLIMIVVDTNAGVGDILKRPWKAISGSSITPPKINSAPLFGGLEPGFGTSMSVSAVRTSGIAYAQLVNAASMKRLVVADGQFHVLAA